MKKVCLLGSLFSVTDSGACIHCNKPLQQAIYDSTFYPNLALLLSAFFVLGLLVWLLSWLSMRNYNPMGNPSYTQVYTDAIRKFNLSDDGTNITITHLPTITDANNLHRRDYNAVPQILPDGAEGITVFSGVFQPTIDLPFLNSVTIDSTAYSVNNSFQQFYNHYHCAVLPLYAAATNEMHSIFFRGNCAIL